MLFWLITTASFKKSSYLFQDVLKVGIRFLGSELEFQDETIYFINHQNWTNVFKPCLPQNCMRLVKKGKHTQGHNVRKQLSIIWSTEELIAA